MDSINLVGKWGGIPLRDIKKRELDNYIYVSDLHKLKDLKQSIVECIDIDSGFLVLKSENIIFRVSPIIFQSCKKPPFFIGDNVKVVNSKGNIEYGIVKDMYWHVKNNIYIYILEVNGKMKSRRYNEMDLERI